MARHCNPRRQERWPFTSPDKASSLKPLISRNPGGPDSMAMSFHFSYRMRISRGADDSCLSTRWCSSMRHMPHCAYTIYGMSSCAGICDITSRMSSRSQRRGAALETVCLDAVVSHQMVRGHPDHDHREATWLRPKESG